MEHYFLIEMLSAFSVQDGSALLGNSARASRERADERSDTLREYGYG